MLAGYRRFCMGATMIKIIALSKYNIDNNKIKNNNNNRENPGDYESRA